MEIQIELPPPHSPSQRSIMGVFNTPGLLEMWVACGTKYGKTLSAAEAIGLVLPVKRQSIFRWVAPVYNQARIGQRYLSRMLPPEPYTRLNQYGFHVPSSQSTLEFRSGHEPENLEGEACAGYVLDECSKLKEQVYASARTTVSLTRGPILAISTPRGKGWFYSRCMAAKEEMEWATKHGQKPRRIFMTAPTSDNPYVPRESIEDARKTLPDRLFRQYYLAEFVDDGTVFIGVRDCLCTDPISFDGGELQRWVVSDAKENAEVVIGVDWGRTEDFTVFFAVDINTRKVVGLERFVRLPYTDAVTRLVVFSSRFKTTHVVFHDKTGVGTALDDLMACTRLNYKGITFTNTLKADMVAHLITAFEHRSLLIPDWDVLIGELDAYEVHTNSLGGMRYEAAAGKHDDCVSALMLAYSALLQYGSSVGSIIFLEDLPQAALPASPLEKYYQSIGEDAD